MDVISELDALRRDAKAAAQTAYVNALIAGDAETAVSLLPASQHGTLEQHLLEQLGLLERYQDLVATAEEAFQEAEASREVERSEAQAEVAAKAAAREAASQETPE